MNARSHESQNAFDDRSHELLAEMAIGASIAELDDNELAAIDALENDRGTAREREMLELAAAALAVAEVEREGIDAMPAGVEAGVVNALEAHLAAHACVDHVEQAQASQQSQTPAGGSAPLPMQPHAPTEHDAEAEAPIPGAGLFGALGWLAAAAAIALAAVLYFTGPVGPADQPANQLLASLETREDAVSWEWGAWSNDPGKPGFEASDQVSGRVVWHQDTNEGVMVFEGLPANDPTLEQYQLWIVTDGEHPYPVDGGVFNVDDQGRAVVQIDPKIGVQRLPAAFGVTVEKPGGVVVSDQDRRVVVAVRPG
jgi:hypothetical protein